jgi:Domain of unknown function (DUF5753)
VIVEQAAGEILYWRADVIPEPLQIPRYTRAILLAAPDAPAAEDVDELLEMKAAKHQALLGTPRQLSFVIGEAALRQQVGSSEVMHTQLTHLAALAADRANLTVQVMPFSTGANPAAGCAGYTILRFPKVPSVAVVSLPVLTSNVHLADHESVARFLRAFAVSRTWAAPAASTAPLLDRIAGELRPPWDLPPSLQPRP